MEMPQVAANNAVTRIVKMRTDTRLWALIWDPLR